MPKLKVYTLGAPSHIVQASVMIVASSKSAAIHEMADRKMRLVSLGDPEFRQADKMWPGWIEAGLLDQPGVYVRLFAGDRIVSVDEHGQPLVAGRLDRERGAPVFVPEGAAVSETTTKE